MLDHGLEWAGSEEEGLDVCERGGIMARALY